MTDSIQVCTGTARLERRAAREAHDMAPAESAPDTPETSYEKARIEMRRATGFILEAYGISIAAAKTGVVEASHSE